MTVFSLSNKVLNYSMYIVFLGIRHCTLNRLLYGVNTTFVCIEKRKKSCAQLYCNICFIVVVWNSTYNISKICLEILLNFFFLKSVVNFQSPDMGFDIFSRFIPFFAGVGVEKRKGNCLLLHTTRVSLSVCDHLNSSGIITKDLILRQVDKESGVLKEEGVQSP